MPGPKPFGVLLLRPVVCGCDGQSITRAWPKRGRVAMPRGTDNYCGCLLPMSFDRSVLSDCSLVNPKKAGRHGTATKIATRNQ